MSKLIVTESLATGLKNRFFTEMAEVYPKVQSNFKLKNKHRKNRKGFIKTTNEVKKVNNFAVTKAPKQTIKTKTLSNVKSQGLMNMLDSI